MEPPCFSHHYSILPEPTVLDTAHSRWGFSPPASPLQSCCQVLLPLDHITMLVPQLYQHKRLQASVFYQFSFVLWLDWLGFSFCCFVGDRALQTRRWGKRKQPGNLVIIKGQNNPGTKPSVFQAQEAACILAEKGYQVSYLVFCCVLLATKAQLN